MANHYENDMWNFAIFFFRLYNGKSLLECHVEFCNFFIRLYNDKSLLECHVEFYSHFIDSMIQLIY